MFNLRFDLKDVFQLCLTFNILDFMIQKIVIWANFPKCPLQLQLLYTLCHNKLNLISTLEHKNTIFAEFNFDVNQEKFAVNPLAVKLSVN